MKTIPDTIKNEWNNKQDIVVLTTVSAKGIPNSIYATQVALFGDNKVLVANNKFKKHSKTLKHVKKQLCFLSRKKRNHINLKVLSVTKPKAMNLTT